MSKEAMKLALEALEHLQPTALTSFYTIGNRDKAIAALREALAEQPAQQEPKIDIYRSFEQWKSGNVLEHGVPRTEFYTKADLDLVEMGWRYGYDAGRAVEQALDKKAENARELGLDYEPAQQEPVAYPEGDVVGPCICGSWPGGKCLKCPRITTPAQRTWVGLTDEEINKIRWDWVDSAGDYTNFANAIEAKLKEKNT